MKLGPLEIGMIVGVIILLFGMGKIAQIGKSLGKSIHDFRHEVKKDEGDKETV